MINGLTLRRIDSRMHCLVIDRVGSRITQQLAHLVAQFVKNLLNFIHHSLLKAKGDDRPPRVILSEAP
jgi:hypothetical protein